MESYPYQDGLLISYWDTSYNDNNVGDHPGEGLILPVDAHPTFHHAYGRHLLRPRILSLRLDLRSKPDRRRSRSTTTASRRTIPSQNGVTDLRRHEGLLVRHARTATRPRTSGGTSRAGTASKVPKTGTTICDQERSARRAPPWRSRSARAKYGATASRETDRAGANPARSGPRRGACSVDRRRSAGTVASRSVARLPAARGDRERSPNGLTSEPGEPHPTPGARGRTPPGRDAGVSAVTSLAPGANAAPADDERLTRGRRPAQPRRPTAMATRSPREQGERASHRAEATLGLWRVSGDVARAYHA